MKWRIHVKLILLFLLCSSSLVTVSLGINVWLKQRNDAQILEQLQKQGQKTVERMQEQLWAIEEYIVELSISAGANQFSIYEWSRDKEKIYDESLELHQKVSGMVSAFRYLDEITLYFTEQERQISNKIRYAVMNKTEYEKLLSSEYKFLFEDSKLYYIAMMSRKGYHDKSSMVAGTLSLSEILGEFNLTVEEIEKGLRYGEAFVYGDCFTETTDALSVGEWTKQKNGWKIVYPIQISEREEQIVYLEVFLPYASLTGTKNSYLLWCICIVFLSVLEILFFYHMLIKIVKEPLGNLNNAFGTVAKGNMDIYIEYARDDDFSEIYQQFNKNTQRLKELIEREYKAKMEANNAELKYLQAQMNPHFLYNAFYQLYRMCKAEDGEISAEFALLLSRYYEYITHDSRKDGMILLGDEIKQAERYLQIQQFRFCNNIDYKIEISEECRKRLVPKFLLQPILENIIKYGLEKNKRENESLCIEISGSIEGKTLLVCIEDNQSGISEEDIQKMQVTLNSDSIYGNSSLRNIYLRLKRCFESCEMLFQMNAQGGLSVRIEVIEKIIS